MSVVAVVLVVVLVVLLLVLVVLVVVAVVVLLVLVLLEVPAVALVVVLVVVPLLHQYLVLPRGVINVNPFTNAGLGSLCGVPHVGVKRLHLKAALSGHVWFLRSEVCWRAFDGSS